MARILIVVPNRATFVTAWCYEYALVNSSQGHQVFFLDLARIESRYLSRPWTWKIDNFLERNNIRNILPSVCELSGVRFLTIDKSAISHFETDVEMYEHFELCLRSTYAQLYGGFGIDVNEISPAIKALEEKSYLLASAIVMGSIRKHQIDHVVTVNGRGIIDGASIYSAKRSNCTFTMIEKVTENWNYYSCMKISSQSPSEVYGQILSQIEKLETNSEDDSEIDSYFKRRQSPENVYARNQSLEMQSRPGRMDYVVFFPTSDYEFSTFDSLEEAPAGSFEDQADAFRALADLCLRENLSLVIRVHPHPKDSSLLKYENAYWRDLASIYGSEVIESENSLRSLSVAKNAVLSVTHNSSIGAELIYEGLPLLITGPTSYGGFFPELLAFNKVELSYKFKRGQLPLDKARLKPWVCFMMNGQNKLQNFLMNSFDHVTHKGILLNSNRIGASTFFELARRFRFWRQLPFKN